MATQRPLVVIVGPTGSGKTAAALEIAQRYGGEIICADSRTIYKGMDVGTAKPTVEERALVPHWGLDLVEPGERYTVADFQRYAIDTIADIRARGKLPLLVGGTGLYVDSVLFDYSLAGGVDETLRRRLEAMTLEELHDYCISHNIDLPENDRNKRYVIRTIERQATVTTKREQPVPGSHIVGIATDMMTLRTRLEQRAEHLFTNGVVEEANILGKKYGWHSEAMTGNIYPLVKQYLDETLPLEAVKERFLTSDYQLAKRQMTWFRRNPYILWCRREEVVDFVVQTTRS